MADNPRQFTSLDYANADMYGALTDKPSTATPLNLPLENLSSKKPSGGISPGEAAYYREEEARRRSLLLEQREAQASREAALKEREIARNLALQQTKPTQLEEPSVSARDYEKGFEIPVSTPERQPLPSTGNPPPTPNGTAARASPLVEPTAHPAPAAVAEAVAPAAGGLGLLALPRSLPQAAGRLVIPGAMAAVDFGNRVVHGQSIAQAGVGVVGTEIGYGLGFVAGEAVAGPIGGIVGGIIGGAIGGNVADYIWSQTHPSTTAHLTENTPNYPPFCGGQQPLTPYVFSGTFDIYEGTRFDYSRTVETGLYGPIESIEFIDALADNTSFIGFKIQAHNSLGQSETFYPQTGHPAGGVGKNPQQIKITKQDGTPEIYPDLTAPAPPPDNLPYRYNASPIGNENTTPSGIPAAGKNKGKTRNVAPSMPSNNTPNGAPFFPGHGGLAPSYLPNPEHQPSNLGGLLPAIKQVRQPLPFAEPEDLPAPRTPRPFELPLAPVPGGVGSRNYVEVTPATITASTVTVSEGTDAFGNYIAPGTQVKDSSRLLPTSSPQTAQPIPISDASSPILKTQTVPISKTPEQVATDKTNKTIEEQKKSFDEQITKLTTIAAILAGLTPIVQGIPNAIANSPTVQAANKATTQGAVCEIAQPGGCLKDAIDDSADKINQNNNQNTANLLDKINAGANAAQLALLELINTKLGNLLPNGGISAYLQNFFDGFNKLTQWLHLDRALNILTFVMTVQNVYFLCDSLKVVTLQMISDMLAVVGIKDKDNNPLNLNEILGHEVESLLKSILGEEELTGFKKEWKALNRIYQAATNTLFAIQNMVFSVLQALEIIGSWNASIGNALKKYLVVGQHAFSWMNPQPNFHNNFFKFLGEALNVVTSLDFVAQSILQGRQAIDDFGKQTEELSKGMSDAADGFKTPEHKATAEAATKSTNESKSPIPSPEEINSIQD
ncbi:hypothetical protein [Nostoc sp.]|uniref:hypothetical protein n=1 Tax=Nostoc sp. TaxID=1180 RepID=UPI002FF535D7